MLSVILKVYAFPFLFSSVHNNIFLIVNGYDSCVTVQVYRCSKVVLQSKYIYIYIGAL